MKVIQFVCPRREWITTLILRMMTASALMACVTIERDEVRDSVLSKLELTELFRVGD